jgi:hypothetical protein
MDRLLILTASTQFSFELLVHGGQTEEMPVKGVPAWRAEHGMSIGAAATRRHVRIPHLLPVPSH